MKEDQVGHQRPGSGNQTQRFRSKFHRYEFIAWNINEAEGWWNSGQEPRKRCPKKRFTSRLNYLLEVGSFALTVLFPFATFFHSFSRWFEIPPPYSETVRTRVSLHITNNSFCLCSSTLRIFDEFLSQRLAVVVVSFSWNWRNWKFYALFHASKRVREERRKISWEKWSWII